MKILVTGFEPFGGADMNPALEAVRALPKTIAGAEVVTLEIPVVFEDDLAAIEKAVAEHKPDILLSVGQAGGRTHITPEYVGINYAHARIPDNGGKQPLDQPIVEGGPEAYFTTLPVHAMAKAMVEKGIPAAVSYTAGTFCCNEVLYGNLHLAATKYPDMKAGFIHVPYAPEQAANINAQTPSMSVAMMTEALVCALEVAVQNPDGIKPVSGGTEC